LSVPANYTAYGIVDLIAHALEGYFGIGETTLTDKFIFSIISEAIEYGPLLIDDLHNYRYREKIMFAATCAPMDDCFSQKIGRLGSSRNRS